LAITRSRTHAPTPAHTRTRRRKVSLGMAYWRNKSNPRSCSDNFQVGAINAKALARSLFKIPYSILIISLKHVVSIISQLYNTAECQIPELVRVAHMYKVAPYIVCGGANSRLSPIERESNYLRGSIAGSVISRSGAHNESPRYIRNQRISSALRSRSSLFPGLEREREREREIEPESGCLRANRRGGRREICIRAASLYPQNLLERTLRHGQSCCSELFFSVSHLIVISFPCALFPLRHINFVIYQLFRPRFTVKLLPLCHISHVYLLRCALTYKFFLSSN
jgi:hypothetical protein